MSRQMNNSISATDLATRTINRQLYKVTHNEIEHDTKNAKPLFAYENIDSAWGLSNNKENAQPLLGRGNEYPLKVNQGLTVATKNAQLLYHRDLNGKQIGDFEHIRFANEAECMDGQQLRVITARRIMMCFITTLATAAIIFITRHN